ncbi:MAG: hypothetical protein NTX79_03610 [Candidatus Micrarchaeota archaeon]|nr:hypothetical protein [Candidatus Micrarchaeota archaeon]
MRKLGILAALAVLASSVFAAQGISGLSQVTSAMSALCVGLTTMLPVAGMLMIILAGVIYAAGQMMGAETRARANVWATACLTGALMAILIAVIAPSVLNMIYPSSNFTTGCT